MKGGFMGRFLWRPEAPFGVFKRGGFCEADCWEPSMELEPKFKARLRDDGESFIDS